MKRCPNCRRDYLDETLMYCLDDGERLVEGPARSSSPTPNEEARGDEEAPTKIFSGAAAKGRVSRTFHSTTLIIGTAGVVFLAVLGFVGYRYNSQSGTNGINSIAVLPFDIRSVESDADYLSEGLAESLNHRLSQLPQIKVSPMSTVLRYKGSETDPLEIGRQLGVDAVVSGRIVQRGEDLLVSVDLTDVPNGKLIWGEQYDRKMADLLATRREIAIQIVNSLALKVSKDEKGYTENSEAYRLYLKGRYFFNRRSPADFARSRDYFQQAIDLDPSYARAYSGLADYYGISAILGEMSPGEAWPKHEQLVRRALELDPDLAEAHNSLAGLKRNYYRDFAGSEQEILRAISLDPGYAEAHVHYGSHLMMVGRMDQAQAERELAVRLEPLSTSVNLRLAQLLYFRRKYLESIEQYRRTVELDQNSPAAHEWLGNAYHQAGQREQAASEWSTALRLAGSADLADLLSKEYAAAGFESARRTLAQKRIGILAESQRRGDYVPAMRFARLYAHLGDREKTVEWLERGATEQNAMTIEILFDPVFDLVRDDPRFPAIVKAIGIPESR